MKDQSILPFFCCDGPQITQIKWMITDKQIINRHIYLTQLLFLSGLCDILASLRFRGLKRLTERIYAIDFINRSII